MHRLWLFECTFGLAQLNALEIHAQAPETADVNAGDIAPEPVSAPAAPSDLGDLLAEDVSSSSGGSFGARLRRYGISPYTHGQIAVEWEWEQETDESATSGFALQGFHLYFGADISGRIVPELFIELEPVTDDEGHVHVAVGVRYAQVDIKAIEDLLIVRAGLFLVPFGTYNSKNYPRFVTKLNDPPAFAGGVVPESWREVGVAVHGSWSIAPERSVEYAMYVANGLEQHDHDDPADPSDDGVDEGAEPHDLKTVFASAGNMDKSVGLRLGIRPVVGLSLGASAYSGAYTADDRRRLSAVGLDLELHVGALTIESEGMIGAQEVRGEDIRRLGFFGLAAYRVHLQLEPFVGFDYLGVSNEPDGDAYTYMAGVVTYPFPTTIPTALLKGVYRADLDAGGDLREHEFELQLAIGF